DGRERRRLIASLVATQQEMAALQDELARTQRESAPPPNAPGCRVTSMTGESGGDSSPPSSRRSRRWRPSRTSSPGPSGS
ncbi:hypothetical protein CTI14_68420, partial [Methylobacterium radiotolerans]